MGRRSIATKEYPPALPDNREDLRVLLGDIEYRTIQPNGIALFDLTYNDAILAGLRRGRKGYRFKIKYDPADISAIYVLDPDSSKYIPVPAESQQYTKGLSLWQHKVIQRYARKVLNEKVDVVALCRAKERIIKIIERDWLKIAQSGPKGRMARFKNIGQPDYGRLVGFAENSGKQSFNSVALNRQQIYLNPMAPHSDGLSDIESGIPSQVTSGSTSSSGEAGEAQSIFGAGLIMATQKKGTKNGPCSKQGASKRTKVKSNKGENKGVSNPDTYKDDANEDLDTAGWNIGELPGRQIG